MSEKQDSGGLKRRDLLLSGSSLLLGASAVSGAEFVTSAQAQQPAPTPPTGQQAEHRVSSWWTTSAGEISGCMAERYPRRESTKWPAEGIRFNNYNVEVQCTPTRSAILTGRHPVRSGTYHRTFSRAGASWDGAVGIHHRQTSLRLPAMPLRCTASGTWATSRDGCRTIKASTSGGDHEQLGRGGLYRVAAVQGERHAGAHDLGGKEGRAFHASDAAGPESAADRGREVHHPEDGRLHQAERGGEKALLRLRGLFRDAPADHRRTRISSESPPSAAGVSPTSSAEMDYRVGQILDAVKEAGIEDNTIVILSSDNAGGGAIPQVGPEASNGPWRGDFFNTPFEGSMRVPAMIRWPGKVPAGVVTNEMLAAVDWLPTLAGMVGASKSRAQGSTYRRRRRLGVHAGQERNDRPRQLTCSSATTAS